MIRMGAVADTTITFAIDGEVVSSKTYNNDEVRIIHDFVTGPGEWLPYSLTFEPDAVTVVEMRP
jgi:hypothetical protein